MRDAHTASSEETANTDTVYFTLTPEDGTQWTEWSNNRILKNCYICKDLKRHYT